MYERFEQLLNENGVTAYRVSKETGIATATFSDWKNGRSTPKQDKLQLIADFFRVSLEWLLGDSEFKTKEEMYAHWEAKYNKDGHLAANVDTPKKGVRISVLGKVAAGIPIEAIQNVEDYEEISEAMASKGEYFALRVHGDSMEPKISDGDVVIVRKQEDLESGEIGVVIVNGCDATIKRVIKQEDGILLVANNPAAYPPKFYDSKSVMTLPVDIVGKVVELRAKF